MFPLFSSTTRPRPSFISWDLIARALATMASWLRFNGITAALMGDRCGLKASTTRSLPLSSRSLR